jgi:hypothetical protein
MPTNASRDVGPNAGTGRITIRRGDGWTTGLCVFEMFSGVLGLLFVSSLLFARPARTWHLTDVSFLTTGAILAGCRAFAGIIILLGRKGGRPVLFATLGLSFARAIIVGFVSEACAFFLEGIAAAIILGRTRSVRGNER